MKIGIIKRKFDGENEYEKIIAKITRQANFNSAQPQGDEEREN